MIIENNKIASSEEIPIYQDTGLAVIFTEVRQNVCIVGEDFKEAINQGVKEAYEEGYLKKLVEWVTRFLKEENNKNKS